MHWYYFLLTIFTTINWNLKGRYYDKNCWCNHLMDYPRNNLKTLCKCINDAKTQLCTTENTEIKELPYTSSKLLQVERFRKVLVFQVRKKITQGKSFSHHLVANSLLQPSKQKVAGSISGATPTFALSSFTVSSRKPTKKRLLNWNRKKIEYLYKFTDKPTYPKYYGNVQWMEVQITPVKIPCHLFYLNPFECLFHI